MKWSGNKSSDFESPEAGTYSAVCYKIIDMGTQMVEWQGKVKHQQKVQIGWELSEKMEDKRPFSISRIFTVSMHEKSSLRKFLAGWRGRDFTDEELGGFDPKRLLGAPCMLTLIQNGEYVNVSAASKLPKGMEPLKMENEPIFFSLSKFDQSVFDKLSQKMKDKIMVSPEYRSLTSKNVGSGFEDMPDDVPPEEDIPF